VTNYFIDWWFRNSILPRPGEHVHRWTNSIRAYRRKSLVSLVSGSGWDWIHSVRRPLFGLLYQPRIKDDDDKCGANGGVRVRKLAPMPLCPPQIPNYLIWTGTRAAAFGCQRLTVWVTAQRRESSSPSSTNISCEGNLTEHVVHCGGNLTKHVRPCGGNLTEHVRPCGGNLTEHVRPCGGNLTGHVIPCEGNLTEHVIPCEGNLTQHIIPCEGNLTEHVCNAMHFCFAPSAMYDRFPAHFPWFDVTVRLSSLRTFLNFRFIRLPWVQILKILQFPNLSREHKPPPPPPGPHSTQSACENGNYFVTASLLSLLVSFKQKPLSLTASICDSIAIPEDPTGIELYVGVKSFTCSVCTYVTLRI
jgi:hypothetical protein